MFSLSHFLLVTLDVAWGLGVGETTGLSLCNTYLEDIFLYLDYLNILMFSRTSKIWWLIVENFVKYIVT